MYFVSSSVLVSAQLQLGIYGVGSGSDTGLGPSSIIQTRNKGFAISGMKTAGTFNSAFYVGKLDSLGGLSWSNTLLEDNNTGESGATNIIQTKDGGYMISGLSPNGTPIMKFDSLGNILWLKLISGTNDPWVHSMVQTIDGGYALLGGYYVVASQPEIFMAKVDASGNILWANQLGKNGGASTPSMVQTADKGFAITGYLLGITPPYSNYNGYITKLDSAGNILWTKIIGPTNVQLNYIIQTPDKGLLVTGYTDYYTADGVLFLLKTDSAGNVEWSKIITTPGTTVGEQLTNTVDKCYMVTGFYRGPGISNNIYMAKFDSAGNLIWGHTIGQAQVAYPNSIIQTTDNGFVVGGTITPAGEGDIALFKFDSSGNTCTTINNIGNAVNADSTVLTNYTMPSVTYNCSAPTITTNIYSKGTVNNICGIILFCKYNDT